MWRRAATLVAGLALLASACGKDSSSPAAAPPPRAPQPDPQVVPSGGASPTPDAPQPPPGTPAPPPSPAPAPAPSPDPGTTPGTAPSTPAPRTAGVRWAVPAPGVFWVGMDDASARWSAADVKDRGVLRLEKRDRDGTLQWSGEWAYRGSYQFSAAVTPGGEPVVAAMESCGFPGAPACGAASIDLGGTRTGSAVAKIGTDGAVRWVRPLEGRVAGADAAGATVVWVTPRNVDARRALTKLDEGGGVVWTITDSGAVNALRLDRTGDVFLTGCYQASGFELVPGVRCGNTLLAARLGPDGRVRWATAIPGLLFSTVDTAGDGRGYVAARGGNPPFGVVALGTDGTIRWSRQIGDHLFANQRGDALLVAAAANGPVAVAGYTYVTAPDRTLSVPAILGFDADGNAAWTLTPRDLFPLTAMVYGADGALLVAAPGGAVDAPGGHVEGPVVVELAP